MWPAQLHPLIETHGVDAVWLVGLEVLGYPALWINLNSEVFRLRKALSESRSAAKGDLAK